MENLYICTQDFQYGDFAVGNICTAKEWGEIAWSWANNDDWDNPNECLLENFKNEQELINFIQEIWEIEILKIDKNNKKAMDFLKQMTNNSDFYPYQVDIAKNILKKLKEI